MGGRGPYTPVLLVAGVRGWQWPVPGRAHSRSGTLPESRRRFPGAAGGGGRAPAGRDPGQREQVPGALIPTEEANLECESLMPSDAVGFCARFPALQPCKTPARQMLGLLRWVEMCLLNPRTLLYSCDTFNLFLWELYHTLVCFPSERCLTNKLTGLGV